MSTIDLSKPVPTDGYIALLAALNDALKSCAALLDPNVVTSVVSPPAGTKRVNSGLFEQFNGASWVEYAMVYAKLASPTFTGTPLAPTAAVDVNTDQIATTKWVMSQGYLKSATLGATYALVASPALTGTPTVNGLAVGYLDIPPNQQGAAYTLQVADRGKSIDSSGSLITVPDNAAQPFGVGATVMLTNVGTGTCTISKAAGVTLILGGSGTLTGVASASLSVAGVATLRKLGLNTWIIAGAGVS